MTNHRYSDGEIAAVRRAIDERRDMRHFVPGALPDGLLGRLIDVALHAPSVGYMQPWRFVRIATPATRTALLEIVEAERQATANALPTRRDEFLTLKIEGIRDAAEVLVAALMPEREPHIFGRRTLPQMDLASVACAIQNMWLLARAEGIGLGWVSFFDPQAVAHLLDMPTGAQPVAILCIGPVAEFPAAPLLETAGWGERLTAADVLFEERWKVSRGGTPTAY